MKLNHLRFFALSLIVAACSHKPPVQNFPPTASASEEIQKLEADLAAARREQVNVLSPNHFRRAEENLRDAQERHAKGKDAKDTLHSVATGRSYLSLANDTAKLGRNNLEEVLVARQRAIDANAPAALPKEFREIDDDLKDVASDLEKNDTRSAAKARKDLQADYMALELRAIKQAALGPVYEAIRIAKNENGEKYAPRALAIAEKKASDTDAFITGNRYATSEIAARTADARAAAEQFIRLTRRAKAGENVSAEDAALTLVTEEEKAAAAQAALEAEQGNRLALLGEKQKLEKEQALQARYEEARKKFSPEEAEVYRQGDKLLIRLRGLEFPSAKAELKSKNFALLAKVQDVIKNFGESSVVVEGYTDSDGSKKANEKLSAERAEAVREYFVSSAGLDRDSIRAVGKGDSSPLASNKTKQGKAQNRRVDVVITPLAR